MTTIIIMTIMTIMTIIVVVLMCVIALFYRSILLGVSSGEYRDIVFWTASHCPASTSWRLILYYVIYYSTAQHSTAQHSTLQHITAQYITAQHSRAQYGTAQCRDRRHPSDLRVSPWLANRGSFAAVSYRGSLAYAAWVPILPGFQTGVFLIGGPRILLHVLVVCFGCTHVAVFCHVLHTCISLSLSLSLYIYIYIYIYILHIYHTYIYIYIYM